MSDLREERDEGAAPDLRTITPNLPRPILAKLNAFITVKREQGREALVGGLRRLQVLWEDELWSLELRAVSLLLADLMDQGWEITASEDMAIHLQPPGLRLVGESTEVAKQRIRRALQVGRDRQLTDPGVRKFIARMHRIVPRPTGRTSIADVIDNGEDLARALRRVANLPADKADARLKTVIDPVIEFCDEDAKCSVTGLRLIDIWRYFRHTWSLEYRSIPGRQICLLIRNAARPNRPVIGIAMLASPVMRMRVRDDWIGWNTEPFVRRLQQGEWDCEIALRSLVSRLERSIADVRSDDLATPDELAFPTERTILRLEQRNAGAAIARQRELQESYSLAEEMNETIRSERDEMKSSAVNIDWRGASEDLLFVRKRAEILSRLLDAKRTFHGLNWSLSGQALLDSLLQHPNGLRTLNVALGEVRKAGLSSQVADVSVCGAIAPYNALLGGKLVALLVSSQEVRDAYRSRYSGQVSIISSQMAGRPIYRPAELKVLTTTSLYGNGSSQYNRLRLRSADYPEMSEDLAWEELRSEEVDDDGRRRPARTAGYGTVHLSGTTVQVLREVNDRAYRARRVNHRFGEGASPRLRQIREAVETLGIDSSAILRHANPRIVSVLELHANAREELAGLFPLSESKGLSAAVLSSLWRRRWLRSRVQNDAVLNRVCLLNAATTAHFFSEFRELRFDDQQDDLFGIVSSS